MLLVILVASTLCSVAFCGLWINRAMRLRDLQRGAAVAQNNRNLFMSLATETLEYSKKHPAINPILESAGFIQKTPGILTNKPSK
jgi:hypothetical protein